MITGGEGSDRIFAKGGDDIITIDGWDNLNYIDGGEGTDVLIIEGDDPVSLSLSDLNVEIVTGNAGDNIFSYEGTSSIVIESEGESDRLSGGNNDDILNGGEGDDTMTGGEGNDIFVYDTLNDSTITNPDIITDFEVGKDKIDLSRVSINDFNQLTIEQNNQQTSIYSTVNDSNFLVNLEGNIGLSQDNFIFLITFGIASNNVKHTLDIDGNRIIEQQDHNLRNIYYSRFNKTEFDFLINNNPNDLIGENATRADANSIFNYFDEMDSLLDIDGNNLIEPQDHNLINLYASGLDVIEFGFLIENFSNDLIGANATRNDASSIFAYFETIVL